MIPGRAGGKKDKGGGGGREGMRIRIFILNPLLCYNIFSGTGIDNDRYETKSQGNSSANTI
jgi:hypothetical protein